LDVKATSGGFERNVHVSLPELLAMRDSKEPYFIYRVYEIGDGTAKLRVSQEMRSIADAILKVLISLPAGVSSDGVSLSPSMLECGAEVNITMAEAVETP
jgi:hypothetical protein